MSRLHVETIENMCRGVHRWELISLEVPDKEAGRPMDSVLVTLHIIFGCFFYQVLNYSHGLVTCSLFWVPILHTRLVVFVFGHVP